MKKNKKIKKLHITEDDFLLANRKAARTEEIEKYGHAIIFRRLVHKSKKIYNRKRLKTKQLENLD